MIAQITKCLKVLVYSNIIIGVSAGIYAAGWSRFVGASNWIDYGLFSFFATLAVYNLDKLWKIQWVSEPSDWLFWIQKHQLLLWFLTFVLGILAFYILICIIELKTISAGLVLLFAGFCAFLYSFPIQLFRLRNISGAKAMFIALVWVAVLGCFPLLNENLIIPNASFHFVGMFTFFLALTIPFDIRDLDKDPEHLKTIPQRFGITKAKVAGHILLVISLFFAIFSYNFGVNIWIALIFLLLGFLTDKASPNAKWWIYALIDSSVFSIGIGLLLFK